MAHTSETRLAVAATDPNLRAFLTNIFARVAGGLALSAFIADAIARTAALRTMLVTIDEDRAFRFTGWGLALLLSPLPLLLAAGITLREGSSGGAGVVYWSVAALVGGSLSLLALTYADAPLGSTFLITASAFVGLSLFGGAMRRNLVGLGLFLALALIGLILATLSNLLWRNGEATLVLNALGVLIFASLIAADVQRREGIYAGRDDTRSWSAAADFGALTLYLNFINLFELLLSFSAPRSRR